MYYYVYKNNKTNTSIKTIMEWKRGVNINNVKEQHRNNKNKELDNGRIIDNNRRDNRRDYRDNRNYNRNNNNRDDNREINRIRRDAELKREEAKNKEFNESNFPELLENKIKVAEEMKSEYLEKIKKTQEQDNVSKILRDPNNWRGCVWIGPKCVKMEKFSTEKEQQIKEYMNLASKNASTIIVPFRKTYYSRNNIDWYESWEKTFTKNEWINMNNQLEREEQEELNKRMNEGLEILYQKRKAESDRYYEETGELDDFAIAEIEHNKYEKWLEDFEKQFEENEDAGEISPDEDYDTDN
jgi:hypothetical protein